jgi:hypothetical protein
MNLEIFFQSDPTGKYSRESYIIKNYKEEYDHIIDYCDLYNIQDITFKEKIYICINNLKDVPKCKNSICQNKVKFKNSTIGYFKYCSNKCISSDPDMKKIKEEKSLEKYGTKTPAESKEIKDKIIKTNQEKWGANSPMCSKEIQNKSKKTLLKNWGVENPAKSKEISERRIDSFKRSDFLKNFKKSSLEKYGFEHPWMNAEIHKKTITKSIEKKNSRFEDIIKKKFEETRYVYISMDFQPIKRSITAFCPDCSSEFQINREELSIRLKSKTIICTNCKKSEHYYSGNEGELYFFIKSIYDGEILLNKNVISPMEIDIYLPELKLAFEFNGLYWHSESQKGKKYHLSKTKKCNEKNIKLTHIWEDDWIFKNEICKSIIKNKIGIAIDKIGARKCELRKVDNKTATDFLEQNHILGSCKSTVKIGLYHLDILQCLMCFTKREGFWTLDRFCNVLEKQILGGASKIFKYFIETEKPDKVISFSDNSMFDGSIYEKLDFKFVSETSVNYKWVISKKRKHKSKFRKERLVKIGYDENKSESEIMENEVGAFKIWDCGLKKWEWRKS